MYNKVGVGDMSHAPNKLCSILGKSTPHVLTMPKGNKDYVQNIPDGTALAENLLARCKTLLNELERFRGFVDERRTEQEPVVDIRRFQTSVGTELKSLQKVPNPVLGSKGKCLRS